MAIMLTYESVEHAEAIHRALTALGIRDVDKTASGTDAWRRITEGRYDALIMGWSLKGLSGPGLLNRVRRHHLHESMPVLIISERLVATDFRLLEEFPCTAHLNQAFPIESVQDRLGSLGEEADWIRKNTHLIDAVMELASNDGDKALEALQEPLRRSPNPVPIGVLAARCLRERSFLKQSEKVLQSLVQRDPNCVIAINELGKTLYAQGRHEEAMKLLDGARHASPHNVSRLCMIGEMQLDAKNWEGARHSYRQALDVDPEDPIAKLGSVFSQGGHTRLRPGGADRMPLSMAGVLNGEGIAAARAGRCSDAISKYLASLTLLWRRELMSRVAFNIGLAYLRWKNPTEALKWFTLSDEWSGGSFDKAVQYVRRLRYGNDAPPDEGLALEVNDLSADLVEVTGYLPDVKPVASDDDDDFSDESLITKPTLTKS